MAVNAPPNVSPHALIAESRWSANALAVCRVSVIVAAAAAPVSTAATSIATAVFLLALIASGAALRIVAEAFRLPAGKGILAFLAVVLASALLNEQGLRAALPDAWAWRKVAFIYLALPLFVDELWKRRLVHTVFWTLAVMLLFSYAALAGWIPSRWESGVVLSKHTAQGIAFAVGALFGAWLAYERRGTSRWLYVALTVAFVLNVLFFGEGRSGYLAFAALLLMWALLAGGWRTAFAALGGVCVLAVVAYAVSQTFKSRLELGWHELRQAQEAREITSVGIRVIFAENTAALIRERPLLGYGLGSFKPVYARYVAERYSGIKATPAGDPHSQYLYIVFEHGAVGLVVFLVMIGALYATFPPNAYGRMAACVLTAWCVTSVFNSHFRTFPEAHFYAFVVAGLGARASPRRALAPLAEGRTGVPKNARESAASTRVLEYSAGSLQGRSHS